MIKIRLLDKLKVVVILASGEVDVAELTASAKKWQEDERFSPDIAVVWDLVSADVVLDWDEVKRELPEHLKHYRSPRDPSSRTAWVVGNDVMHVVVDAVHLAWPWATQWRVFNDPQEAIEWVTGKSDACS